MPIAGKIKITITFEGTVGNLEHYCGAKTLEEAARNQQKWYQMNPDSALESAQYADKLQITVEPIKE